MLSTGEVVGPYTIVRKIGEGQFGEVWLALDERHSPRKEVALKILKVPDPNAVLKEVLTWAKADGHANVLPILDARVFPTQHGDITAVVSSFLPDGSLRDWINRHQSLSIETAVELACGVLDGLAHLHDRRIVHRDLKPENVLMCEGRPLLTDFGIARLQFSETDVQTFTIAGSKPYMAPEAFEGVRSPQIDVWAAAVMSYEMLAGHRPFSDYNTVVSLTPPPLPISIPRELRKTLDFALRKDPALRFYKTARELRRALLDAVPTIETHVRPAVAPNLNSTVSMESDEAGIATPPSQPGPPESASGTGRQGIEFDTDDLTAGSITLISKGDSSTVVKARKVRTKGDFKVTNE